MEKTLFDACAEGDLSKVKELLAQGCPPNGKDHHESSQDSQVQPIQPLADACMMRIDTVKPPGPVS